MMADAVHGCGARDVVSGNQIHDSYKHVVLISLILCVA